MKKLLTTFLCFSICLVYSQIKSEINFYKGENLYIEIPLAPKNKIMDKNIIIESYLVEIDSSCNEGKKIKFEVLPGGTLAREITLKAKTLPTIKLIYTNKGGDNLPIKIERNKIQNFITYEELTKNSSIDNLLWIANQFKNVYIINNKNQAKKVQIQQLSSL